MASHRIPFFISVVASFKYMKIMLNKHHLVFGNFRIVVQPIKMSAI